MKKWILLIFLSPVLCNAEEFSIPNLGAGMHSFQDANQIPDNAAAYLQNVYSDIQGMTVERNGYVKRDSTVLGNPNSVTGLWSFTGSDGAEWIISFSSQSFYKNTSGGTPTKFGLNATSSNFPDAAVNLGKIWFTNGVDDVWWFDGTSTGVVASAPNGRLIESWRTRIVISNVTGALSTVYFSEEGDGTNWTLGGLPTDPFTREIGGANDGQYVRCLGNYYDSLIVGRKNDLWAMDGFDQDDLVTRLITNDVGCIEPHTMKVNGNDLIWLSNRGIEEMSGRTITNISEPIRDITDVVAKNTNNQRTNIQTNQSDWSQGTSDNSVYIDTHTSPGDIQLTFPDSFDSFRNGQSGTKSVWESYCQALTACTTSVVSVDGILTLTTNSGASGEDQMFRSISKMNNYRQGTTFYFSLSTVTAASNTSFSFGISSYSFAKAITSSLFNDSFFFTFKSTISNTVYLDRARNTTDGNLCSGNCQTGHKEFPSSFSIYVATTFYSVSIGTNPIFSGTHGYTNNPVFMYMDFFYGNTGTGIMGIDSYDMKPQTATYTSQLLSIGSLISSWNPVSISETDPSDRISYQFGSTNTASISSISNFTSISNGQTPTVSTNPYAGFKTVFRSTIASEEIKLSDFITSWNEGGQAPAPIATVYDRRYWISYTTSTQSDPRLNRVLVWQRNKSWTLFDGINAASFAIWRDALHFGNSNDTGYVYKFDIGENDDGSNISSVIRTKSYDFGNFIKPKEFRKLYIGTLGGGGSYSVSYDIDRYGTSYSLGSMTLSGTTGQQTTKFPFPLTQLVRGREIQFEISKSDTSNRLKLYNLAGQYELKEEE